MAKNLKFLKKSVDKIENSANFRQHFANVGFFNVVCPLSVCSYPRYQANQVSAHRETFFTNVLLARVQKQKETKRKHKIGQEEVATARSSRGLLSGRLSNPFNRKTSQTSVERVLFITAERTSCKEILNAEACNLI